MVCPRVRFLGLWEEPKVPDIRCEEEDVEMAGAWPAWFVQGVSFLELGEEPKILDIRREEEDVEIAGARPTWGPQG